MKPDTKKYQSPYIPDEKLLIIYDRNNRDWRVTARRVESITIESMNDAITDCERGSAKYWYDLYHVECRRRQDDAARLGAQIVALDSELMEMKNK